MCDFEFNIPINKEELLHSNSNSYYVRNIIEKSNLREELRNARRAFQDTGPEAVIDNFDIYFSVIYHGEKLDIDLISNVTKDLVKSLNLLISYLNNILSHGDIDEEVQIKTLKLLKMFMYLLVNTTISLLNNVETNKKSDLSAIKKGRKGKKKSQDDDDVDFEEQKQIDVLLALLHLPIYRLWNPPVCEEQFINLISDLCFGFLTRDTIKYEKDLWHAIFCMFGILIKKYNYSLTLTVRLTQAIIDHEHLESIVPSGIKLLVEEYNCSGLVRELVRELTEWQSDENRQDVPGSRHCSIVLTEMTANMPALMLPEIVYLLKYLNSNSYTLRNCILSIIAEVTLTVLCKENLSEEHIQVRTKLLEKLRNYILDTNSHVRSKVLQHWNRLHAEQAIPKDIQLEIMKKAVGRLQDKATLVRKNALQLITTFLKCNPYAATLDIDYYKKELKNELNNLGQLDASSKLSDMIKKSEKKVEQWSKIEKEIEEVINECLETVEDEMEIDSEVSSKSEELLQSYLNSGNYKKAFYICRDLITCDDENRDNIENMEIEKRVEFFLIFMKSIYTETNKQALDLYNKQLKEFAALPPEKIEELKKCEEVVSYLSDVVTFLEIIESIFPIISLLLKSATMTDVNEAIEFCITAHQFKIKSAPKGLAAMLTQMNTTDNERQKAVIEAYRVILLSYEGPPPNKAATIATRLISLMKEIKANEVKYLSQVIKDWTEKGDLDHAMIQQFWHIFIGRESNSHDDQIIALELLSMISLGRKTTIERNMNLVAEIIFSEKGIDDPRFFIVGCNILSLMESEVDVSSTEPCFRISVQDNIWDKLKQSVLSIFLKKDPFCFSVITAAVQLVYKVCQKPDVISEELIKQIDTTMKDPNTNITENDKVDSVHLAHFCHLLGEVAVRQFVFLDEIIYKELKRRNNIKDTKKKKEKQKGNISVNISSASAVQKVNSQNEDPEESYLEGAVAEDAEAEFILNICENEIVLKGLLGGYVPMLVYILKHPHKIDTEIVQASATQALMRFMIVSNNLCEKLIPLLMTTLERNKFASVKNNVFVNLADLLHRFPNLIEPWSGHIFKVVKDEDENVRLTAVSILSKLIMEDMIRVKGTIADLALCIVDKSDIIVEMTEEFFSQLSQKGNSIYNVLPDIISRLSNDEAQIDNDIFKKVMTFLVNLIGKDKQIESLVEKLCMRFKLSENIRVWKDIGFCLSVLNYNEKSLIRLCENYTNYKHCLEEDEIYDLFMCIVNKHKNSSKNEVKDAVKKLDSVIKTGEITNDDINVSSEPIQKPKSKRGRKSRK